MIAMTTSSSISVKAGRRRLPMALTRVNSRREPTWTALQWTPAGEFYVTNSEGAQSFFVVAVIRDRQYRHSWQKGVSGGLGC